MKEKFDNSTLRKKCPYSEFFWSIFSRIRTEYREILGISLYSVQMRENTDQKTPNTDTFYAIIASQEVKLFLFIVETMLKKRK